MKKKILEILSNYSPDEVNFDNEASSLIDNSAKEGQELSLLQAHPCLDEKLPKERSKQTERYSAVKEIFSQEFSSETEKEKYYKSVFGVTDLEDPDFLNQYSFKFHDFRNIDYSFADIETAKIIAKLTQNDEQCIVVIRLYNVSDSKEKADSLRLPYNCLIYYSCGKKTNGPYILDEQHPVYLYQKDKDAGDLNESEKLTLKKLAFQALLNTDFHNLTLSNHILSQFAAKPDNFLILDYLIKFAQELNLHDLNLHIGSCVGNAFEQAIRYSCTSNLYAILSNHENLMAVYFCPVFFKFSSDFFDQSEILDEMQLKTHTRMVDILMLLYQKGNGALTEFLTPFFEIIDHNPEDKISTKLYKKRQIVVLFTIHHHLKNSFQPTISPERFVDLVNLLNDETLILKFFDLADIKFDNLLPYQSFRCLSLSGQLFTNQHRASIVPKLTLEFQKLLCEPFPREIALLVLDYLISSNFNKVWTGLNKFNIEIVEHTSGFKIHKVKAPKQKLKSSDCGYWSLFNACWVLAKINNGNSNADSSPKTLRNQLENFKVTTNQLLEIKEKDLTALDLENFFNLASKNKTFSLLLPQFPHLNQNLLSSQESLGIPVYSIINSSIVGENQKLDSSYLFGGCLEHQKVQMTINFYRLAENIKNNKNQPWLHLVLVGVAQHWHLQLLTFSYSKPGVIDFWIFDSGSTSTETHATIISHLQDVLHNANTYAESVADEVMPSIAIEIEQLSKITAFRKDTFYDRCQLLIQFFDILGSLPMAKQFLPILKFTTEVANFLQKQGDESFKNVSKELSRLYTLRSEKTAATDFFSERTQIQSSSTPQSNPQF